MGAVGQSGKLDAVLVWDVVAVDVADVVATVS